MNFFLKESDNNSILEFNESTNCAEKIVEKSSISENTVEDDEAFVDYKALFKDEEEDNEDVDITENNSSEDTNNDLLNDLFDDEVFDDSIENGVFDNKLLRGYIPYTENIVPNTDCTDLTVTSDNKLVLATQIITKTFRVSFKSILISISLTILNLFI